MLVVQFVAQAHTSWNNDDGESLRILWATLMQFAQTDSANLGDLAA